MLFEKKNCITSTSKGEGWGREEIGTLKWVVEGQGPTRHMYRHFGSGPEGIAG